jgi:Flp pilus assembly protein TadB
VEEGEKKELWRDGEERKIRGRRKRIRVRLGSRIKIKQKRDISPQQQERLKLKSEAHYNEVPAGQQVCAHAHRLLIKCVKMMYS